MQRTQIYLTDQQRKTLMRMASRSRLSMAEIIRQAIDSFIGAEAMIDPQEAYSRTLGALPDLEIPSREEWDRGYG